MISDDTDAVGEFNPIQAPQAAPQGMRSKKFVPAWWEMIFQRDENSFRHPAVRHAAPR
jgi:hypothetical protein